ncbi:MAG: CocE/NonD family hydrolase [Pseudomonadota bacterium]
MSDRADSEAWRVSPQRYLAQHPPRFDGATDRTSCYVTVRDGTRLAVDTYLPAGRDSERLPAILIFTPYYRRFALADGAPDTVEPATSAVSYRDAFVPHGYALVVVDTRGAGASFGIRDGLRSPVERDDYYDIVEWVIAQSWSDGSVGATGVSYVGAAACFLAGTGHPAVRAVAPLFAVWDTYRDQQYPGGLHLNRLATDYQAVMEALDQDRRELLQPFPYFNDPHFAGPAPVDEDTDGALLKAALAEHVANFELPDFIRHLAFSDNGLPHDPDYTIATISPYRYVDGIGEDVAYLCVSGWMDGGGYANGAINRFLSLPVRHKHLLLGPWDHGARTNISPYRERQEPEFALLAECLRFFDHYLKGEDTGLEAEAPVHYFTVGEERWRASHSWPPASEAQTLYLAPEHELAPTPDAPAADAYRADYGRGTGTHTRYERLSAVAVETYYDDWDGRDAHMLVYTSAPLEQAVTLSGHAIATLHIAADQRDTGLFVYLEEVSPDGQTRYVTEGVIRALHRKVTPAPNHLRCVGPYHSYAKADASLLEPGVAVEIRFSLLPTSWHFAAGQRIRVAIAAADRDHFARIPDGRPARLQILRGGSQASSIELPFERPPTHEEDRPGGRQGTPT